MNFFTIVFSFFFYFQSQALTIGFIPGENPELLKENGLEIAKILQKRIDEDIKIYISKDYAGLITAMKERKVDFAFFSALTFVEAEKIAGAKVLLKKVWDSPFYFSTILTRSKDRLRNIQNLKGKKIAFVDEKSASGYLYPNLFFKKQKIDAKSFFKEIVFSGSHDQSVKLLKEGKVDAIAVFANDKKAKDSAWQKYGGKTSEINVLWTSNAIPNDPFCVRKGFYESEPRLSHDLMFAMIETLDDVEVGDKFKKLLGVSSLMLASTKQYDPVREVVNELNITNK